jgi:hypothetical protein
MIHKSDMYRDLLNETNQNAFQILTDQYRWYAIFAVFFPALIIVTLYNYLFLKTVSKGDNQCFYLVSFLLGCLVSGFLYYISFRNSPISVHVRILEWLLYFLLIVYEYFYLLKLKSISIKRTG